MDRRPTTVRAEMSQESRDSEMRSKMAREYAPAASAGDERADELLTAAAALRHERDCPGSQPQYFIERRDRMKAMAEAKIAKSTNNSIDTVIIAGWQLCLVRLLVQMDWQLNPVAAFGEAQNFVPSRRRLAPLFINPRRRRDIEPVLGRE